MTGKLGHKEAVAMSLGALIGGGIFAVLGVAANIAGKAVLLSYTIAGLIALASGYSYSKLSDHFKEDGGSFLYIKKYSGSATKAGMIAWFLILGYIGSMAMYAYAFGAFLFALIHPIIQLHHLFHGIFSILIIIFFLVLNLRSIESSGKSENIMVYGKIAILLLFGILGITTLYLDSSQTLSLGTGGTLQTLQSPLMAISVIFVSFQGFQLLSYNLSAMEGGSGSLQKAIFQSLTIATLIYLLIAFVTTSLLSPAEILTTEETILAYAAAKMFTSLVVQKVAFVLVAFAALFSTASAINATLFSTARLLTTLADEEQVPAVFARTNNKQIPANSLILLALLTCIVTFIGSLHEITAYASISFIIIFAVVNYIAIKSHAVKLNTWIPRFGLLGTTIALALFVFHTISNEPELLQSIILLFGIVIVSELLYFGTKYLRINRKPRYTTPITI